MHNQEINGLSTVTVLRAPLADAVDWTGKATTPVKNQKSCGSKGGGCPY